MPGSFTTSFCNQVLDYFLKAGTLTNARPAAMFIALSSAAYSDAATGASMNELSGNGYARQNATFGTASAGHTDNITAATTFTASGGAWSAALSMYICDASTTGNLVGGADLSSSVTLQNGDSVSFAIGDIDVDLT